MDFAQAVCRHQNINILGKPPKPMREKRHSSSDGKRNLKFIQSFGDLLKRLMNRASLVEMHAAFF
jgi:hypothetical protein